MANPRYERNDTPRPDRTSKQLGQLGALLELSNRAQAPGLEQQQLGQQANRAKQQMAVAIMQLMQDRQGQQQSAAQHAAALAGQGRTANIGALSGMAERGDATASEALGQLIPAYGGAQKALHQREIQKGVQSALPEVQAVYSKGGPNLAKTLAVLQSSKDPEVWNAIPWDQLNQSLTPQATAPSASGPRMAEGFLPNTGWMQSDPQAQTPLGAVDARVGGRRNPLVEAIYRLFRSQTAGNKSPALEHFPNVNPQDFGYPN